MAGCPPSETLAQLLAGGLAAPLASSLRVHLCSCARCQTLLDQLSDDAELRNWRAKACSLPAESAADGALARIVAGLCRLPVGRTGADGEVMVGGDLSLFLAPPQQEGDLGSLGPSAGEAELGRGGMGIVLRARDPVLQRTLAVKILRPELANDKTRARFVREAQAAARVSHDHVVRVFAVANPPDSLPFFAMEYLAGPTLAEKIRIQGALQPRLAATLVAQVAQGLAAAHAAGLIHRDIKPSNILFDPGTGRAKITDFGLARLGTQPSGMTQEGMLAGTPAYMSPEQARGLSTLDGRSDVYSLGATLYEALTGQALFHGAPHLILQQVVGEDPRPPRHHKDRIPRDLETICLKCLEKEPRRRYDSAGALAEDLQRWLKGEPIQARPVGRAEQVWRWCARKPIIAGLTAALLLVLLAGFSGVTWQWRRAKGSLQLAQDNLEQARQALDTLGSLYEAELCSASGMQPLRRKMAIREVEYLERLLSNSMADPSFQLSLAVAYHRLGIVTGNIGKLEDALRTQQRAAGMLEKFCGEHPNDRTASQMLAATYLFIGLLNVAIGEMERALAYQQQALAIGLRLVRELPNDPWHQRNVALFDVTIGDIYREIGRPREAQRYYEQARAILKRLVREHPSDDRFQEQLAVNDHVTGLLYNIEGAPSLGLRYLKKAKDRLQLLVREKSNMWWEHDLAEIRLSLATTHWALGQRPEALASLEEVRHELERLVKENACVREFQTSLAEAYLQTGNFERENGYHEEALRSLKQAHAICQQQLRDNPAVTHLQVVMAESYLEMGLARRALRQSENSLEAFHSAQKIWKRLAEEHPTVPGFRSGLARVYYETAELHRLNHRPAEAFHCYVQAFTMQIHLSRHFPGIPESRHHVYRTLKGLVWVVCISHV